MEPRKMILGVVLGGPLLGALMGMAADPTMVSPPEPHWRKARPDPIFTAQSPTALQAAYNYASGPIELSGNWYDDHMPTWKRRALEREIAAQTQLDAALYAPPPEPEALPEALPEPAPAPAQPAFAARVVTWSSAGADRDAPTPLDAAAEERAAAEDAGTPPAAAAAAAEPAL